MSLFDYYVMVDWSGGARRRGNREDAIWIAHGAIKAEAPDVQSPFSRTEALRIIRCVLNDALNTRQRVLVSFDFAYGYPANFSAALRRSTGVRSTSWKSVWRYLNDSLKDDLGTNPNRAPTNRSNRFEVADRINKLLSLSDNARGPFWCTPRSGQHAHIPQNRPARPFKTAQGYLVQSLRLTDLRVRSDTPFRLFGTGSVGSQSLTGIPRLYDLRNDPFLAPISSVWPFETGWAKDESWLPNNFRILHAEIYPSVRRHPDPIKDRGQVIAMWEWVCELDQQGRLWREFSLPDGIKIGSAEDIVVRSEEGWILGAARPATR
jgi:precorrin-8X/cobalt-precorrin-8 methylmutase